MNFLMTFGLVMVLVGCAMAAGYGLSVLKEYRRINPEDDLDKYNYDESITVRKPIPVASYLTSAKPVDKTESPKRSAFEHTGEDGKSNVHHHDEETDGGHARVVRSTGKRFGDEYVAKPSSHFGASGSSGNNRRDDKEDTDDFVDTYRF